MSTGGEGASLSVARPAPLDLARLRRGGLTFGASQVTGMILGFLGSLILVRAAAQADVGLYQRLQQAILAIGMMLQLGLAPGALRFVPTTRGAGGERATALLRRRLFTIQAALWLLGLPALLWVWPRVVGGLDAPELATAGPFVAAAVLLASFDLLADAYLRAFRRYSASAVLGHLTPRLLTATGFFLLWRLAPPHTLPWEALVCVYLTSLLITSLGYAGALWTTTPGEVSEPREALLPPRIPEILSTTTAMGLRSAAAVLFVASDLWILGLYRSSEEVAVYGIAAALLQILSAIPGMASSLLPQEFALLHADGRTAEIEELARTSATVMSMISLAGLAGLVLAGPVLIPLLYGRGYAGAWSILLVLAVGAFWDAASGSAGFVLQMTGHHVRLLGLALGGAALNAVLSLSLARIWGGHGVALATTVTLLLMNAAMVYSVRRLLGVRTFVYLKPAEWMHALRLAGRRSGASGGSR
ncbi:MAG TPA: lipopolysaccharide biosynthesis protein [Thermoanaerobaculia bacterium]|nr:lipopolysaccharide biosynthesis protein [Thermoanaerobaculia bacterium]